MVYQTKRISKAGGLNEPDENGIRLLDGFTSRVVARSGEKPVSGAQYNWHPAPDGGACFNARDSGWIYVSNCELPAGRGGVGALRFSSDGLVIDSYQILEGTSSNCAGGATPWGSWLSCEETHRGLVFECDPHGNKSPSQLPILGRFRHEAVAIDVETDVLYLTEDERDGGFYRFLPAQSANGRLDINRGILQIAEVLDIGEGFLKWHKIEDPDASTTPTRYQVPNSTAFKGGEGVSYRPGEILFSTKGDNRVWLYEISNNRLSVLYDDDFFQNPILTGVDNIAISKNGLILVTEDGGDMQIVVIDKSGNTFPIVQIEGQSNSEVTGPAFNNYGDRLYFSSQRGHQGQVENGITYEVSGPFEQYGF